MSTDSMLAHHTLCPGVFEELQHAAAKSQNPVVIPALLASCCTVLFVLQHIQAKQYTVTISAPTSPRAIVMDLAHLRCLRPSVLVSRW